MARGKAPVPRKAAQSWAVTQGICQPPRKSETATALMIQRLAHSTRK